MGGAENAGVENAGVENGGAITYGKPKFEKRLTVFTTSNLESLKYIIISYVECSTASYHNLWNFGTPTVMGLSPQWDISAKHGRGTFCRGPPEIDDFVKY